MTFLITNPATRINDCFVSGHSNLDFTPISNNFKSDIVEGRPNFDHRFYATFYKKIGVDIVTETAFNYPYPFITEKTYRSIASLRPFIIIGPYSTLAFIRQLGFRTFPTIIDETYDTIVHPEQRFISVSSTIKKFVSRPIEQVINDLYTIKDDLQFNQNYLSKLYSIELEKFKEQI